MNNTIQEIIYFATTVNFKLNVVLCPLLYINLFILIFLSISWSVYLFNELIKVSFKYKKTLKSRNFLSEHQWLHDFKNFYSKKVRNIFLIAICLSECTFFLSIIVYSLLYYELRMITGIVALKRPVYLGFHLFLIDFGFYRSMFHIQLRIFKTLITTSYYALYVLVRILTQYLGNQYSYYKKPFCIKLKLQIPLMIIIILFICGIVRKLVLIHFICIVLFVIYEFIQICIATKKLRLLLKQRLNDAIMHENQGRDVIYCYRIANKNYKNFSIVLVIAFFFQMIAFAIYCIHPIVVTIIAFPDTWIQSIIQLPIQDIHTNFGTHPIGVAYNIIICAIQEIFLAIGISLQVIPYLLVTFIRLIRNIRKKIIANRINPEINTLFSGLLKENHLAYIRNHY